MIAKGPRFIRLAIVVSSLILLVESGLAATINTRPLTSSRTKSRTVHESPRARRHMRHLARSRRVRSRTVSSLKRHHYYERFYASSYANDITDGDVTAGEDPVVRQAAIDALGNMNGTVLAIEPTSGRVLAMVNQKLALSSGAQPCSTIKVSVALAALSEGIITKETQVRLGGRSHMNLTLALAHLCPARSRHSAACVMRSCQFGLFNRDSQDIPESRRAPGLAGMSMP